MSLTKAELAANFDSFTQSWKSDLPNSIAALDSYRDDFLESYSRIVSMNAWRSNVLEGIVPEPSLEFFVEALNDALISHVFSRLGSWRSALKSLRSCIENTCYSIYYKDHPIELRLWELGQHRPGFAEIHTYLEKHPDISPLGNSPVTGLAMMKKEYSTLSRAVHASAKSFRMSPNIHEIILWKPEPASLGQWKTREQHTLCAVNLLLTTVFRDFLSGTQRVGLRKALAVVIRPNLRQRVKKELKVNILSA